MGIKSSATQYGTVAVIIHWLSAVCILVLMGTGFRAGLAQSDFDKASVLSLHVPLGVLVLLLTLMRVAWWVFADRKPIHGKGEPAWQVRSAKAVHGLFYIVILGMAASGIGMMALSGAGDSLLSGATHPLPDFWDYPPRVPHRIGAAVMSGLLFVHIGAAFYHQFIMKDGLLGRIWFGGSNQ